MSVSKNCIGVMSGTSLDGIDIAYVQFANEEKLSFTIVVAETIAYTSTWKNRLKDGFHCTAEALTKLDADYGVFLGNTIQAFIEKHTIKELDLIASHGHTIFHNPKEHYTLQIGNGPQICAITDIKTICDFRVQDIALGGQGAPLVPVGDSLLFSDYDFCLNIGGFANVSSFSGEHREAYDICPTNIVLNVYANQLGLEYDDKGAIAASGTVNKALLEELNAISFYKEAVPKSLGYEFVLATVFPIIEKSKSSVNDILRTFVEHMAIQIAAVLPSDASKTMLITGGGAYNDFFMERLKAYSQIAIVIPSDAIINYKEALIFALLGHLKEENRTNCLASVTGASRDHSSGIVYNS